MSYLSSQRYLYITQRSLEYGKVDECRYGNISQNTYQLEMWKRKAL